MSSRWKQQIGNLWGRMSSKAPQPDQWEQIQVEYHRALQAAQVSDERFQFLFNKLPVGLLLLDPQDNWKILNCNSAFAAMNQYEPSELIDQPATLLAKDPATPSPLYKGGVRDGFTCIDCRRKKDGQTYPVEASIHVLQVQDRELILEVSRDISTQKKNEQELQNAYIRLNQWVHELELRNKEVEILHELGSFLQSCLTAEEAYQGINQYAPLLFNGQPGALYLMNASRNLLDMVANWGYIDVSYDSPTLVAFGPDDCWALRRGQKYLYSNSSQKLHCKHIHALPGRDLPSYVCIPLMAQHEIIGLFYVQTKVSKPDDHIEQLAQNVTERLSLTLANLRLRETLRQQSIRDPLTDLYNRRYMEETLDRELRRAARHDRSVGVIMLDIDHFKRFNDDYGHPAGDLLLERFGHYLQSSIRGDDVACRYGGEEFVLIFPESKLEDTLKRAEEIRLGLATLDTPVYQGQSLRRVTISLGVAGFPEHGADASSLIQMADRALYKAKKSGRNRCVVAEAATGQRSNVEYDPDPNPVFTD